MSIDTTTGTATTGTATDAPAPAPSPARTARPSQRQTGPRKSTLKRSQTIAPWALLAPFLALFALTFLIPIGYALVQSLTTVQRQGLFGEKGVQTVFPHSVHFVHERGKPGS